jgi:Gas vesicle protein
VQGLDELHTAVAIQPARASLVDLLDRVLATGVVITGDVTISIADVDLIHVSLNAIVASVRGAPELP